jgi:hypothetical protein
MKDYLDSIKALAELHSKRGLQPPYVALIPNDMPLQVGVIDSEFGQIEIVIHPDIASHTIYLMTQENYEAKYNS